jgi:hypothetical protein
LLKRILLAGKLSADGVAAVSRLKPGMNKYMKESNESVYLTVDLSKECGQ